MWAGHLNKKKETTLNYSQPVGEVETVLLYLVQSQKAYTAFWFAQQ